MPPNHIFHKPSTEKIAFGMLMPDRAYNKAGYRFGYNGMEMDNETKGEGITYFTTHRYYDSRLGRWFSIDPETHEFPDASPFIAMDDNPIAKEDQEGDFWNFVVGAAIGLAVDYGTQVAGNLIQGKSLAKSLTDVDGTSLIISTVAGAATSGLSALETRAAYQAGKTVTKIAAQAGKEVVGIAADQAKKVNSNIKEGKSAFAGISVNSVAADYVTDKIVDYGTGKLIPNSSTKVDERQLDRAARLNTPTARPSRVENFENKVTQKVVNEQITQLKQAPVKQTTKAIVNVMSGNTPPSTSGPTPVVAPVDNTRVNVSPKRQ